MSDQIENGAQIRDALIERWFDPENTEPETVTDEQILARIEDLVGEGWHRAGLELERLDVAARDLSAACLEAHGEDWLTECTCGFCGLARAAGAEL